MSNWNLLVLVVMMSLFVISCDSGSDPIQTELEVAQSECLKEPFLKNYREAVQSGDSSSAISNLEKLKEHGCRDSNLYKRLGLLYQEAGRHQLAAADFEAAVEMGAEDELLVEAGDSYYAVEEYKRALFSYESYLKNIGNIEQHKNKAQSEVREMFPDADVVSGQDQFVVIAMEGAGYAAMMLENSDLARSYFKQLVETCPDSFRGYLGLAQLDMFLSEAETGAPLNNAEKAFSLMGSYKPAVVHVYGLALLEAGDVQKAIAVIEPYLHYEDAELMALYEDLQHVQ